MLKNEIFSYFSSEFNPTPVYRYRLRVFHNLLKGHRNCLKTLQNFKIKQFFFLWSRRRGWKTLPQYNILYEEYLVLCLIAERQDFHVVHGACVNLTLHSPEPTHQKPVLEILKNISHQNIPRLQKLERSFRDLRWMGILDQKASFVKNIKCHILQFDR